ncbi:MAG: hypothetical protein GX774_09560 [Armatimonadetes bacterium]|nr:hypothetical protein [Armatimonadota bacterium]
MEKHTLILSLALIGTPAALAQEDWDTWPPRAYLLKSLTEAVPDILDFYHPETGRFGTEPWICLDQNVLFPLAAAWAIRDPANPWYHSDQVLQAIAGGGEALVDAMDDAGMWLFKKKDGSTWGQIHMPWTYSRWIRAYALVRDALPAATRAKWEKGLRLGFTGICKYMEDGPHNIPTHHAMALYIAGECFDNQEWKQAAAAFMARIVRAQDPVGFWSEHFGPVVGYNDVYVDALGVYYHFSKDPVVLEALRRAGQFHASVLWPDGTSVAAIDERQTYSGAIYGGNVGFTWTPEGRGFLLMQMARWAGPERRAVGADYAASLLLYSGDGPFVAPPADRAEGMVVLGKNDALIRRRKPWQWALSGYACPPVQSRWIQDRQNLVDLYHDSLGLVAGGGNTKLQPYWSTFTVGDPALLRHQPGDEAPGFVPTIDLRWTPDDAEIANHDAVSVLTARYGEVSCQVSVEARAGGTLRVTYQAPRGRRVEAHLPLLRRAAALRTATGRTVALDEEPVLLDAAAIGEHFVFAGLKVTMPPGASLRWPARPHNPYAKDGAATLAEARLVLVLPFTETDEHAVILSHQPEEAPPTKH